MTERLSLQRRRSSARELIIILDDDASLLKAIKRLLMAHGFAVQAFASAHDFVKSTYLDKATCIVLDIHMKGTSGIELRRRLSRMGINVPVIFLTADDSEVLCEAAQASGCIAYLRKPFSPDALISAIQNCQRSGRIAARAVATVS